MYDSDGNGLAKSEYHVMFLVKMKGVAAKIGPGNTELLMNGSVTSVDIKLNVYIEKER